MESEETVSLPKITWQHDSKHFASNNHSKPAKKKSVNFKQTGKQRAASRRKSLKKLRRGY